jgi:hypothetical protein
MNSVPHEFKNLFSIRKRTTIDVIFLLSLLSAKENIFRSSFYDFGEPNDIGFEEQNLPYDNKQTPLPESASELY